ncbi:MAG TPA: L,D-transpeptidase [Kofleriaceae bacterium]|nr:L,D-transpeptidase [Kofleriaceae bacterium]
MSRGPATIWCVLVLGLTGPLAGTAAADVVETTRGSEVYKIPHKRSSESRGMVMKGARFEVRERRAGRGCKGEWLKIDDRAWLCSAGTRATTKAPGGDALPAKAAGNLPHRYVVTRDATAYDTLEDAVAERKARVLAGQGGFKYRGTRSKGGQSFVKTDEGWVPADQATIVDSIDFNGQPLTAVAVGKRLAFVGPRAAPLYDRTGRRLAGVASLERQRYLGEVGAPVSVGGTALVPTTPGGDRFVRTAALSMVDWAPAPAGIGATERWLDVDMTEQLLVAYEGTRPVYVTLVSTANTATPVGEFRIEKKRPFSRMTSKPHYRTKWDTYTPWVISINGRIALHAVYWHEEFGRTKSQGCVNLAPTDASWVWDFTSPALPPGWLRIESDELDQPTLVRLRRSKP